MILSNVGNNREEEKPTIKGRRVLTPIQLGVLAHYSYATNDVEPTKDNFHAIQRLTALGLLVIMSGYEECIVTVEYMITTSGLKYITALCDTPVPVKGGHRNAL
jgi:hypothetical protein